MKGPHTNPPPSWKTISTTIATSTPQVCLPPALLTHPPAHPPHTSLHLWPRWRQLFPWQCTINIMQPETVVGVIYWSSWSPSLPPSSLSSSLIQYVGLRRDSSLVIFEWLLYHMGWSEGLSWTEKIISENWCLGEALEPLIIDASPEVLQRSLRRAMKSLVGPMCITRAEEVTLKSVIILKWEVHLGVKHISVC